MTMGNQFLLSRFLEDVRPLSSYQMFIECFWLSWLSEVFARSENPWQVLNSFSLQRLCGGSFITAVFFGCFTALLKASKVHLVQLDSKLVELNLLNLVLVKSNFELNGDDLTEGLTLWSFEGQVDGVDLFVICLNVGQNFQGNCDLHGAFTLDFLFNWNVDDFDWEFIQHLLISKGEDATLLPWPIGIVKNLKFFVKRLAWDGLEETRCRDNLSSLGVP